MSWSILEGDALERLADLDSDSVQTCVTSPPYWGLRDYGTATWEGGDSACDHKTQSEVSRQSSTLVGSADTQGGSFGKGDCRRCGATRIDSQFGLEPTPELYVANLVEVFREVRRVLRDDGTLWLNLGDSYYANAKGNPGDVGSIGKPQVADVEQVGAYTKGTPVGMRAAGIKIKDLVGVPWSVAFALRADGWYLRSEIIWHKPAPMPESVRDRPTKSHEQIFLLSKNPRYFYDDEAIREDGVWKGQDRTDRAPRESMMPDTPAHRGLRQERVAKRRAVRPGVDTNGGGQGRGEMTYPAHSRNKRSVWTVNTTPFPGAHFATFPPKLIEPCILAGAAEGDTVLDPFAGAGTTGLVALRHNRNFIGIELNPEYAAMARERIRNDAPIFNVAAEAA